MPVLRPTLQNDVHPLFASDRWIELSPAEFEWLQPAVRLASRFLLLPDLMPWWIKLCLGQVQRDPRYPIPDGDYFGHVQVTNETIQRTKAILVEAARFIKIKLLFPERMDGTLGFTMVRQGADIWRPTAPSFSDMGYIFWRDKAVSVAIVDERSLLYGDSPGWSLERELGMHFQIAVTLVHEATHVINCLRFGGYGPEAWHTPICDMFLGPRELGVAWETACFPWRVCTEGPPGNVAQYGVGVVWLCGWPGSESGVVVAASQHWIASFFQEAKWAEVETFGWGPQSVGVPLLSGHNTAYAWDGKSYVWSYDMLAAQWWINQWALHQQRRMYYR